MEVWGQRAGACGRATGARAIHEPLPALVSQAVDSRSQGSRGKGQRVRDCLEALACDDVAPRLGTAEDARLLCLFQAGRSRGEGGIGQGECEGPHRRVFNNKIRQTYTNPPSHDVLTLLSAQNLCASNFPGAADRTQLGLTLGWTGTDRGDRPGHAVYLRKGIVRDDLAHGLIVCWAQYREMLVSKQGEL
jgi:hypothetical protein